MQNPADTSEIDSTTCSTYIWFSELHGYSACDTFTIPVQELKRSHDDSEVQANEGGVPVVEEIDTEKVIEQYALQVSLDCSQDCALSKCRKIMTRYHPLVRDLE